jgi:uncharacterized protein YceH (UPF0502 family)
VTVVCSGAKTLFVGGLMSQLMVRPHSPQGSRPIKRSHGIATREIEDLKIENEEVALLLMGLLPG